MSRGVTRRQMVAGGAGAAGVLGTGVLAAACGPAGQGGQPAGDGLTSGTPVQVTLWDRDEAGYPAFMDQWLPAFNQRQNKVKLQWETRPPEWGPKLTAAIVAGTPPDSAAVFGTWFRSLLEAKQALTLDKHIKASSFDANDFSPGIYKGMNIAGQQVGIPQYINTNALYINKEAFKKAGVALPQEGWTLDQFLDAAQKVSRGPSTQREVWGLDIDVGSITTRCITPCWAAGAQYNDPKSPDVFTLNTPQNVKAVQWVHDLFWRHRVGSKNNDDRGGVGRDEAVLIKGNVAMMVQGTHILAEWKTKAQADWDVAPLPKGPGGKGERLSMDGYIIPAGVKNPDAAWFVTQAITDKDANKMRAEILGLAPARKSQFDVWAKSIPGRTLKNALPTDEAKVDPGSLWPKSNDVSGAVNPIWRKLFVDNQLNVPDALKQMQEAVAGALGAAGK